MSKYGLRLRSVHKNKNIPGYILNLVVLTAYSLTELITGVSGMVPAPAETSTRKKMNAFALFCLAVQY